MTKKMLTTLLLSISFLFTGFIANANEVTIVDVKAHQSGDKTWSFAVTLKHADAGWDHYANEWQVLTPDNRILATRTLYHPHVNEQPFTRNTSGVKIPSHLNIVYVIAKDTVHGLASKAAKVNLKTGEIEEFTVKELKKMRSK